MYGPRTGGPGNWSPSPSPWIGTPPYPRPGTVEYKIVAAWVGGKGEVQIREVTYGRKGTNHDSLAIRKYVEVGGKCRNCTNQHLDTEGAYDCAQEAAMLALILKREGPQEKQDFVSIARERGHTNG